MLKYWCVAILILCFSHMAVAQDKSPFSRPISAADSVRLKRYLDSLKVVPYFSHKCQRYYDSALSIVPWNAYWWQQKAMMLFKQKKCEAGAPYLDSAVKYNVKAYIDYRGFMKCIFQRSYHDAIRDFQAAKVIIGAGEVMDHTYDFYIGLSFLQLNRLDSAEYYLAKTVSDQAASRGADWVHYLDLFYLGIVYFENENYTQAISTLDKAIKQYPNFSDAKYYKALCCKKLNKDAEALATMTDAGNDFKKGYTINEDNAIYETYPYQIVKPGVYEERIRWLAGEE
jgi:tetratricopeptide (TPR) repeat protein